MESFFRRRALGHLHRMLGPDAEFRDGQLEAIRAIVEERSRLLVVQKTGWGKSVVYFIATRLLRDGGGGPTLLISPLLSLMRNQVAMAARIGVAALSVNSANRAEWDAVEDALRADACDVLLVSPERLANKRFQQQTLPLIRQGIGLLVVQRGPLSRPTLRLQVIRLADQAERLAWLAQHLPTLPGSGIVYCLTVVDCERVSACPSCAQSRR